MTPMKRVAAAFALATSTLCCRLPTQTRLGEPQGQADQDAIGYGAGDTYYQYAQLCSRYLSTYLPDHLTQSIPGAGGLMLITSTAQLSNHV
jgi:hypothetical protein